MGVFRIGAWLLACSLGSCAQQTEESSPRHRITGGSTGDLGSSGETGSGASSGDTASGGAPNSAGSAGAGSGGSGVSGSAGCAGTSATCGDACPEDPLKTAPGACGCGQPEDDKDEDGVADCSDECPEDPERTKVGPCGCGAEPANEPQCTALKSALKHRYSFDGSGADAADSIGGANAKIVNASLTGSGFIKLSGSDNYVDLPNSIISALTSATLEAWITWSGGDNWQRVFDFGDDSSGVEGNRGTGGGYVFLAPKAGGDDFMRAVFRKKDQAEVRLDVAPALAVGQKSHLALVIDDTTDEMRLYLNGVFKGSVALTENLTSLHDVNNWLGRSQYQADGSLNGDLHEFRIYSEALSTPLVKFSFDSGSDAAFLVK